MDSGKQQWKEKFLWVVPISRRAKGHAATLDEDGNASQVKFPIAWSFEHYRCQTSDLRLSPKDLDKDDSATLTLLQNLVSHLPSGKIDCKSIVQAKGQAGLIAALGKMAGKGSSLDRLLASAKQGPAAKKRPAEASPPHKEPTPKGQAKVGAAQEGARSKTKKKRATGGNAEKVEVDSDRSDQVRESFHGEELQPRPGPTWLSHLSKEAYDDPYQAGQELFQVASARVKQADADRREKEAASKQVKELEAALKAANAKAVSSNRELQLAKDELKVELQKREGLEEKLKWAEKRIEELDGWHDSWAKDKEDLHARLDQALYDGVEGVKESFDNAIEQVEFYHPDLKIDRKIVAFQHEVIGDRIQVRSRDGTGAVIFRRPWLP